MGPAATLALRGTETLYEGVWKSTTLWEGTRGMSQREPGGVERVEGRNMKLIAGSFTGTNRKADRGRRAGGGGNDSCGVRLIVVVVMVALVGIVAEHGV